jgi:hypothetical protein
VARISAQSLPSKLADMVPQEVAKARNSRSGPSIGVNRPTNSPLQNSPQKWQRPSRNLPRYGIALYWVECRLIPRRTCNVYQLSPHTTNGDSVLIILRSDLKTFAWLQSSKSPVVAGRCDYSISIWPRHPSHPRTMYRSNTRITF